MSFIADGPDAVRVAVRENLRRGATQIKIMVSGGVTSEFDPLHSVQYLADEVQMAVATAAQWETYVTCHVFTEKAIRNCIDNGAKVVEHIPFLTTEVAKVVVEREIMFATAVAPVYSVTEEPATRPPAPPRKPRKTSATSCSSASPMPPPGST